MKKTLLASAATLSFGYANAQMKLGNNPTTTNANAVLEMETTNKGLLLPRVALTSTTAFAPLSAHVAGMAVYNTATAGDVTPGYYFSNGAKWVRVADANVAATNLYTADGSLTGARTVSMGANNLAFTGTGNIGIGTTTPNRKLAIVQPGDGVAFMSAASLNLMSFESTTNSSSIGHSFTTKNSTGVSKQIAIGINPNFLSGNGVFYMGLGDGYDLLSYDLVTKSGFTNVFGGNFGIGTTTPTAKLEVAGTTKTDALQVVTGAGVGKVLTSDAAGLATWATPTSGANLYTADGTLTGARTVTMGANNLSFNGAGNVGIGTTTPTAKLDVAGTARIQTTAENTTSIKTVKLATDGTLGYSYQVSAFPTINSSAQDDPIGTTGTFTGTINGNAMTYTMTNKGASNGGYVAYYDVVIAGTGFGFVPLFVQITPAPSYIGDFLIANVVGGTITATTFKMKIRRLDAGTPWSAPTPMGILAIKQ